MLPGSSVGLLDTETPDFIPRVVCKYVTALTLKSSANATPHDTHEINSYFSSVLCPKGHTDLLKCELVCFMLIYYHS